MTAANYLAEATKREEIAKVARANGWIISAERYEADAEMFRDMARNARR